MKSVIIPLLAGLAPLCFATPGAVDEYDCHRDFDTGEYHCHGSEDRAKQQHTLIGISSRTDVWRYSDGPMNVFSGAAGELELAFDLLALHGGYAYQIHMTGAEDYNLTGWDIGLKAGPNIARLGLHPYVEAGYFSQNFNLLFGQQLPFSGIQYGVGLIWNRNAMAFDLRLMNKTIDELEQVWTSLGAPGGIMNATGQLGLYFRL